MIKLKLSQPKELETYSGRFLIFKDSSDSIRMGFKETSGQLKYFSTLEGKWKPLTFTDFKWCPVGDMLAFIAGDMEI